MSSTPSSFSSFSVSSGSLCFGAMHNIWTGATAPPTEGFPDTAPETSGTVIVHQMEYNIPALNGTWMAFKLMETRARSVCGWFVCHSDTDPAQEIDKILRVSGSPYEEDSGSSVNNADTKAEGVFVINRYDWGYYDKRSEEINRNDDDDDEDEDDAGYCEQAGLVDYGHAKAHIKKWKKQKSKKRGKSDHGVWMMIPDGEYMFGRFGFNDERTFARSFLFFTTNTSFPHTKLAGLQDTLRLDETEEERFDRRLREGYDFSGIRMLKDCTFEQPPHDSECFGPYDPSEHIFREEDIECLRLDVCRLLEKKQFGHTAPPFPENWKGHVLDLLNELVLSYMEHTVLPKLSNESLAAVARGLFPEERPDIDRPYPDGFDGNHCEGKIRQFFAARSDTGSQDPRIQSTIGMCQVLVFIVMDTLSRAGQNSRCSMTVPTDVRSAVLFSFEELRHSRVYWNGRN